MKKQIGMTGLLLPTASLCVLSHIWRRTFAVSLWLFVSLWECMG